MSDKTSSAVDRTAARLPELDGLRGIAILLVLEFHFLWQPGYLPAWLKTLPFPGAWFALGVTGVDLFFVLSGFLIGRVIWEHGVAPGFLRTFFARRLVRIVPLYVLYLLCATGLGAAQAGSWKPEGIFGTVPIWSYWTFLHNFHTAAGFAPGALFGHLWSIAIEEQFYVVAPFLRRWLPTQGMLGVVVAFVILAPALRFLLEDTELIPQLRWWEFTPARFDGLALGVVLAYLLRPGGWGVALAAARSQHRLVLVLLGALLALLPLVPGMDREKVILSPSGMSLLVLFYAVVVAYLVLHGTDSRGGRLLRMSWLRWVGRVSYFLYLFHFLAHSLAFLLRRWLIPSSVPAYLLIDVVLGFLLLGFAAAASWRWLEQPLIRLGHRSRYDAS